MQEINIRADPFVHVKQFQALGHEAQNRAVYLSAAEETLTTFPGSGPLVAKAIPAGTTLPAAVP